MSGKHQLSNSYKITNGKVRIDVSQLVTGTYIVTATVDGKIVKHKIIKK